MNQETFRADLLTLARERRGLSQLELAQLLGVTQSKVSKTEASAIKPTQEDVKRFADKLAVPVSFFHSSDPLPHGGVAWVFHRKQASLPARDLRRIHAHVNMVGLEVMRLLNSVELDSVVTFPQMDVDRFGKPEEVAKLLRAHWGIPPGPLASMTEAIERAGGVIIYLDLKTEKLDAIGFWAPNRTPMFIVNKGRPIDRVRFSLAHEVGHLVMHALPTPDREREADRFAAEFLMPALDIETELIELGGITVTTLGMLKVRWRVSIASLIYRAHDLRLIDDRKKSNMYALLNRQGRRRDEGIPLADEKPKVLPSILQTHFEDLGYSLNDVLALTRCNATDFLSDFGEDLATKHRFTVIESDGDEPDNRADPISVRGSLRLVAPPHEVIKPVDETSLQEH